MSLFFHVTCLKRTRSNNQLTFWKPHRAGYTIDLDEAGVYDLAGLEKCAGKPGIDWDVTIALGGRTPDGCTHTEINPRTWECGCTECIVCQEMILSCSETDDCQAHTRMWRWV